jgi:hypothetical protein
MFHPFKILPSLGTSLIHDNALSRVLLIFLGNGGAITMNKSICSRASLGLIVLTAITSFGRAGDKARTVEGQVLFSTELPAVKLKFDKDFKYVGNQTFNLYKVARAEQHFFVDADEKGRIKRLYWVQFEGYLPSNKHTYAYKKTKTVTIGGLEFIADAWARNLKANPGRPDSDGNLARSFLEAKGCRWPTDDVLAQRLVHLVDERKRNELMIIYAEDLSAMRLIAKDLTPGGRSAGQWEEISKALLERALKGMDVKR